MWMHQLYLLEAMHLHFQQLCKQHHPKGYHAIVSTFIRIISHITWDVTDTEVAWSD